MPFEIKVKAVTIGNSVRMTIPNSIVDYLQIKPGDILLVSVIDHEIKVRKSEKKE